MCYKIFSKSGECCSLKIASAKVHAALQILSLQKVTINALHSTAHLQANFSVNFWHTDVIYTIGAPVNFLVSPEAYMLWEVDNYA